MFCVKSYSLIQNTHRYVQIFRLCEKKTYKKNPKKVLENSTMSIVRKQHKGNKASVPGDKTISNMKLTSYNWVFDVSQTHGKTRLMAKAFFDSASTFILTSYGDDQRKPFRKVLLSLVSSVSNCIWVGDK